MESVTPKKSSRDHFEALLLKAKALAFSMFHLQDLIQVVKLRSKHEGIQLKPAEIIKIIQAISKFDQCKMLVFGLGNDSPFWCSANGKGRTVFLEDFQPWYDKVTESIRTLRPTRSPIHVTLLSGKSCWTNLSNWQWTCLRKSPVTTGMLSW